MQEIEKKWRGNLIKNHGACKTLGSLPGSVCEINKFLSSANKIESSFEALFKSFMYRIKNSGPRIDPCGTPQ